MHTLLRMSVRCACVRARSEYFILYVRLYVGGPPIMAAAHYRWFSINSTLCSSQCEMRGKNFSLHQNMVCVHVRVACSGNQVVRATETVGRQRERGGAEDELNFYKFTKQNLVPLIKRWGRARVTCIRFDKRKERRKNACEKRNEMKKCNTHTHTESDLRHVSS